MICGDHKSIIPFLYSYVCYRPCFFNDEAYCYTLVMWLKLGLEVNSLLCDSRFTTVQVKAFIQGYDHYTYGNKLIITSSAYFNDHIFFFISFRNSWL